MMMMMISLCFIRNSVLEVNRLLISSVLHISYLFHFIVH